jgi:hypothetical protein
MNILRAQASRKTMNRKTLRKGIGGRGEGYHLREETH